MKGDNSMSGWTFATLFVVIIVALTAMFTTQACKESSASPKIKISGDNCGEDRVVDDVHEKKVNEFLNQGFCIVHKRKRCNNQEVYTLGYHLRKVCDDQGDPIPCQKR